VPLQFNKLDLRDYLFHAYNVEVNGVRSFINQPAPRRKAGRGKWYRPRAQKMMIVELVKPFVWPEPPAESERKDFDYSIFKNMQKARDEDTNRRVDPSNIPLRTQTPMPRPRVGLIAQAEQFLKNGVEWSNGKTGDDKWTEVETDVKV
jgi:large subunit ribosomal protein L23